MNPKEGLTRRELLFGALSAAFLAACVRPETRPTPPPVPTAPAKPSPTPTEIPTTVEELKKSGWKIDGTDFFDIYIPPTWKSIGRAPLGGGAKHETSWVLFYSREMVNTVSPNAIVEISSLPGTNKMNFDEFVKTFRQEVQQVNQGRIPVTETQIQLDGQQAIRVDGKTFGQIHPIPIYEGRAGEGGWYETRIGFIRQSQVWHIAFGMWTTGFRERDEMNRQINGDIFNKMLSSFKFLQ